MPIDSLHLVVFYRNEQIRQQLPHFLPSNPEVVAFGLVVVVDGQIADYAACWLESFVESKRL
jgi:hypothetical protein